MIDWLFEIDTLKLSTKDTTYGGNSYSGVVITKSFSGIEMKWDISGNGLIAPNEMTFEVSNTAGTYSESDFAGEFCTVRLIEDGSQTRVWKFKIERAISYYKKIKCYCVDFLQEFLSGDYPNTKSPKEVWPSSDIEEDDDDYCIPVILGTAYIPVRSVNTGTERYYVLGASGPTYTVTQVSSPHSWPNNSVWLASEYTMNGYISGGYQLLKPIIADANGDGTADAAGLWLSGDYFYDMPCKYSRSDTSALTNPAEWIEYVLEDFGVASGDIDATSFGNADTLYDSLTLAFNGGFYEKESRESVLSNLLAQVDSYLVCSDKVELYQFDASPVETITMVLLKSFSPARIKKSANDSGRVQWPGSTDKPYDVLTGKAVVPTHDAGSEDSPSSEILECRLMPGQSINAQKAGILFFQKKYEQSQRINFSVGFGDLTTKATLTPGQVVTVDNVLYGGTNNVIITDMTINSDLKVDFTGVVLNYLEDWGDLTTTTVDVVTDSSSGFTLPTTDANGDLVDVKWEKLLDIPDRFLETATLGINVTDSYLGFYDGSDFTAYIDASGNMRAGNPDTGQGFVWNQSAGSFTISGSFTVQNPADVRGDLNVQDGATNGMTDAEATLFSALQDQTDNKISVYVQNATPSWTDDNANHTGDQWYKPSALKWYQYNGSSWAESDGSIYDINALAAGKTTYHYASGTSSPSTSLGAVGDFCTYKNTSTGVVKLYKKTGSSTWTEQAGSFTDGADNTTTTINGGVITTGYIKDSGENLVIDFSDASITVNHADGLLIESSDGIVVNNGSIKMKDNTGLGSNFRATYAADSFHQLTFEAVNAYSGSNRLYAYGYDECWFVVPKMSIGFSWLGSANATLVVNKDSNTYALYASGPAYIGASIESNSITPTSSATYDLGSSTYKWDEGYINNLNATSINFGDTDLTEYEEGAYTATLTTGSGSITLNSSYNTLAYTRIGNQVTVTGQLVVSSVSSPSGTLSVNLPFSIDGLVEYGERFSGTVVLAATDTQPSPSAWSVYGVSGSSASVLKDSTTGSVTSVASWIQASTTLTFGFTYFAA